MLASFHNLSPAKRYVAFLLLKIHQDIHAICRITFREIGGSYCWVCLCFVIICISNPLFGLVSIFENFLLNLQFSKEQASRDPDNFFNLRYYFLHLSFLDLCVCVCVCVFISVDQLWNSWKYACLVVFGVPLC